MAEIEVEGISQLTQAIDKAGKEVLKAAQKGLRAGGMDIIADAQENLRKGYDGHSINTTGQLSNSGKVQPDPSDTLGMDVGFFAETGEGHAEIVEYGSTKRWWAPLRYLHDWAMVKLSKNEKDAWPVAKGVQKKIHERGLRPHPFFKPAVEKNQKALLQAIEEAEKAVMGKNYGNV